MFSNSPGPRTIRRAPASGAVPNAGAGPHHPTAGVGSGGIGLVDDAGIHLFILFEVIRTSCLCIIHRSNLSVFIIKSECCCFLYQTS